MKDVYILTCNPTNSDHSTLEHFKEWLTEMLAGKVTDWSIAWDLPDWDLIEEGDSFLLQGDLGKGIIGFGEIRSSPYANTYNASGQRAGSSVFSAKKSSIHSQKII